MKWMIYILVLGTALLAPVERSDVENLQPIEAVAIYKESGSVVLKTELGDLGEGKTLREALDNLKQTAPGIIYLDTADYLLLGPDTKEYVAETAEFLKDHVRLCALEGEPDLQQAVRYLNVHRPKMKLRQWSQDSKLQVLSIEKNRFILSGEE